MNIKAVTAMLRAKSRSTDITITVRYLWSPQFLALVEFHSGKKIRWQRGLR